MGNSATDGLPGSSVFVERLSITPQEPSVFQGLEPISTIVSPRALLFRLSLLWPLYRHALPSSSVCVLSVVMENRRRRVVKHRAAPGYNIVTGAELASSWENKITNKKKMKSKEREKKKCNKKRMQRDSSDASSPSCPGVPKPESKWTGGARHCPFD